MTRRNERKKKDTDLPRPRSAPTSRRWPKEAAFPRQARKLFSSSINIKRPSFILSSCWGSRDERKTERKFHFYRAVHFTYRWGSDRAFDASIHPDFDLIASVTRLFHRRRLPSTLVRVTTRGNVAGIGINDRNESMQIRTSKSSFNLKEKRARFLFWRKLETV